MKLFRMTAPPSTGQRAGPDGWRKLKISHSVARLRVKRCGLLRVRTWKLKVERQSLVCTSSMLLLPKLRIKRASRRDSLRVWTVEEGSARSAHVEAH